MSGSSKNFVKRSMIMLFRLMLFCSCETYLSTSCQVEVFGDRTKDVRQIRSFPGDPRFVGIPGVRSCVQRRRCSNVTGRLKKARSPLHNMGSTLRSDNLWMCRVSATMITLSFPLFDVLQRVLFERTHLDRSLHVAILKWDVWKNDVRMIRNKFILQFHREIVSKLRSVLSRIKHLERISSCHVHNCSTVRKAVGQQIPRGLVRFCDKCFAIGCFVLLSLVQRHEHVFVQVWQKT